MASLAEKVATYWDPDKQGSLNQLFQQMFGIEKGCCQITAKLFKEQNVSGHLIEYWGCFRKEIETIRKVEEGLNCIEKFIFKNVRNSCIANSGDFSSLIDQHLRLRETVNKVYKDSLYPLFCALQNIKKGWNPSSLICRIWDSYSCWNVKDPRKEISKEFPVLSD